MSRLEIESLRIEIKELQRTVNETSVVKRLKWPKGKTFRCAWCGDRANTIEEHDGMFDEKTGKPVCSTCGGTKKGKVGK